MNQKIKKYLLIGSIFLGAAFLGGGYWLFSGLQPTPSGHEILIQLPKRVNVGYVAAKLEQKGIVANSKALTLYSILFKRLSYVGAGTYKLRSGMSADQVVGVLRHPMRQLVCIPEGWWIRRVAKYLEKKGICSAREYTELSHKPQMFQKYVSFTLPKEGSLEGYLFPDTYDLPAGTGAKEVIRKQLKAFERKVLPLISSREDFRRILTIASMVELETSVPEERVTIAGVIQNRLRQNMKLQIDPTVLYGIQEWRPLKPGETEKLVSPYNTYHIHGLPPGPICSPSVSSVKATLNPARHDYLFFVAKPGVGHHFSKDFQQHKNNINVRKAILRAQNEHP